MSPAPDRAPLRLAILNRRFWPISNSAEMEVAWLSAALVEHRCAVDVLTVRWQKFWPERSVYRGAGIIRFPKPLSGPFGKHRFNKVLVAHLIKQAYDGLIAFGLGDDACAATIGLGSELPIVLRLTSEHIDVVKTFGKRECATLNAAHKILVDCAATGDAVARGCDHSAEITGKIVVTESCLQLDRGLIADVAEGVDVDPFRSLVKQSNARAALSDAHPILQINPQQTLVVTCASMANDLGVCDLVKAWKSVQMRDPQARLWIVGEDSNSRKIWDEVLEQDLVYSAIMPGFFDHLKSLFQAADLYIHPARNEAPCCLLTAARGHGVCTIATDTDDALRAVAAQNKVNLAQTPFVERPGMGLFVPRQSPQSLAHTIHYALADADFRIRIGNQSRRSVAQRLSDQPMIDEYLKPFLQFKTNPQVAVSAAPSPRH